MAVSGNHTIKAYRSYLAQLLRFHESQPTSTLGEERVGDLLARIESDVIPTQAVRRELAHIVREAYVVYKLPVRVGFDYCVEDHESISQTCHNDHFGVFALSFQSIGVCADDSVGATHGIRESAHQCQVDSRTWRGTKSSS